MTKRSPKAPGKDLLLAAVLVALGGLLGLWLWQSGGQGARVQVRVAGQVTAEYSLALNGSYPIQGAEGGTNLLVIQNGTACIAEASCPDKLCAQTGRISRTGQSIICLPNQVVVEVLGAPGQAPEVDAAAG